MTVAFMLEDMLGELGHEVVGLAMRLPQALQMAQEVELDFAILDINLAGRMSFPVAEVLASRGVPFIFASGYGSAGLDAQWRDRARVMKKPFDLKALAGMIETQAA